MSAKGKKITIKMIRGKSGTTPIQRKNLIGLGLTRNGRIRELEDTPMVRGMIKKVEHMIEIIEK